MGAFQITLLIIMTGLSLLAWLIAYLQFKERGFLFNNAYIYASKSERETMNKSPHYRQSGIVFAMLGVIFATVSLNVIFTSNILFIVQMIEFAVVIIYAIASSIQIQNQLQKDA